MGEGLARILGLSSQYQSYIPPLSTCQTHRPGKEKWSVRGWKALEEEGVEKRGPSCTVGGNPRWSSHYGAGEDS